MLRLLMMINNCANAWNGTAEAMYPTIQKMAVAYGRNSTISL